MVRLVSIPPLKILLMIKITIRLKALVQTTHEREQEMESIWQGKWAIGMNYFHEFLLNKCFHDHSKAEYTNHFIVQALWFVPIFDKVRLPNHKAINWQKMSCFKTNWLKIILNIPTIIFATVFSNNFDWITIWLYRFQYASNSKFQAFTGCCQQPLTVEAIHPNFVMNGIFSSPILSHSITKYFARGHFCPQRGEDFTWWIENYLASNANWRQT